MRMLRLKKRDLWVLLYTRPVDPAAHSAPSSVVSSPLQTWDDRVEGVCVSVMRLGIDHRWQQSLWGLQLCPSVLRP